MSLRKFVTVLGSVAAMNLFSATTKSQISAGGIGDPSSKHPPGW